MVLDRSKAETTLPFGFLQILSEKLEPVAFFPAAGGSNWIIIFDLTSR
jgi:hypothetical protein